MFKSKLVVHFWCWNQFCVVIMQRSSGENGVKVNGNLIIAITWRTLDDFSDFTFFKRKILFSCVNLDVFNLQFQFKFDKFILSFPINGVHIFFLQWASKGKIRKIVDFYGWLSNNILNFIFTIFKIFKISSLESIFMGMVHLLC